MPDAIVARALAKRYGRIDALQDLTLRVARGECLGFLGPNGAGKSTAVKMLVGLVRPTGGAAEVLGKPVGDRATRARIGYLPELFRYPDWLAAREVLAFHAQLLQLNDAGRAIDLVLLEVGLSERAGDRVGTFSKGMQQRLGLGAALLGSPELVFLDEPTSALDPVGRHDVRRIIRDLTARGTAVFLNSHLLSEVEQVCDRVAVVDHGRVIASGTMDELLGGSAVTVRVGGLNADARARLDAFGPVDDEGEHLTFTKLKADRAPELVSQLVSLGAQVYEVVPRHQTLEDLFLQLLHKDEA